MGRVTLRYPADLFAAVEILVANAALKPLARQVSAYQMALGRTWGLLLDGRQVAVLGFWPIDADTDELFFACRPIAALGRAIVPLQRAGRLIIHRRLHDAGVRRVVAFVHHAHDPGQRLARLAGFVLHLADPPSAGFQQWVLERWVSSSKD